MRWGEESFSRHAGKRSIHGGGGRKKCRKQAKKKTSLSTKKIEREGKLLTVMVSKDQTPGHRAHKKEEINFAEEQAAVRWAAVLECKSMF